MALNWLGGHMRWQMWLYMHYWFVLKTSRYNHYTRVFLHQLGLMRCTCLVFTDPTYHFRLLRVLQRAQFLVVGLVGAGFNPWWVLINIPAPRNTFLVQLLFIYFIVWVRVAAAAARYQLQLRLWHKRVLEVRI